MESESQGILPAATTKRRPLRLLVSLYRSHLTFRGLVDLAVIAWLALAFTADWSLVSLPSFTGDRGEGRVHWFNPGAIEHWTVRDGPGHASLTLGVLGAATISEAAVRSAGEPLTAALGRAAERLESGDPEGARQALAALNPQDPSVSYARAVVDSRERQSARHLAETLRRLRRATDAGIAPAFALTGQMHLYMAHAFRRNPSWRGFLVTLDGAGNAHAADEGEHLDEAFRWTQRAAAFREPAALRNLGMIAALGLRDEPDIHAAASFWRDAARAGDGVAAFELGLLHASGTGVAQDVDGAVRWFREASGLGVRQADFALATTLRPRFADGDLDAAAEAAAALERTVASDLGPQARAAAHELLARYLDRDFPAAFRDPARAADHADRARALSSRS